MRTQASLTGESEPIRKEPHGDPFCKSGTEVQVGAAHILCALAHCNVVHVVCVHSWTISLL